MPDPGAPDRWSPPRQFPRRWQVWLIMVLCVLFAGATVYLPNRPSSYGDDDGLAPAPMPMDSMYAVDTTTALPAAAEEPAEHVESRELEALGLGYQPFRAWQESPMEGNTSTTIDIAAEPGYAYLVVGRAAADCDLDLYISDELQDASVGPDAQLTFNVAGAGVVSVQVRLQPGRTCPVGYGVYRAAQ